MTHRMTPEFEARLHQQQHERNTLSRSLKEKFLPSLPMHVADAVFNKAWEDGHASGEHEVAIHYEEIAALVESAYVAGWGRMSAPPKGV